MFHSSRMVKFNEVFVNDDTLEKIKKDGKVIALRNNISLIKNSYYNLCILVILSLVLAYIVVQYYREGL